MRQVQHKVVAPSVLLAEFALPIGACNVEFVIQPACLVYLTDLQGTFPDKPPDYPVLWVTTTDQEAPWGETVRLE